MMWSRRMHNDAPQSRARVFDRAERRQTGSDFSPLIDAFHPSFPAAAEDYISEPHRLKRNEPTSTGLNGYPCHSTRFRHNNVRRQVNSASTEEFSPEIDCATETHRFCGEGLEENLLVGTSDPLSKLPPEVSDLILSYLSPAALDAARHTCKYWRTRILSNTWVLSSVLGVKGEDSRLDGSRNGNVSHPRLLRKLDHDSDLPSTALCSDAWRPRFRIRKIDFSIPSASSTPTRPAFVAAARTGTQNGLLAFLLQQSPQGIRNGSQNTLVIYCFDSAEIPWYAGAVHDVEGQGAIRITGMIEIRRCSEWVLKVEIGDTIGLYLLTARKAFSSTGSRFLLKSVDSLEKIPGFLKEESAIREFDRSSEPLVAGDQSWNVIASFPPDGGVRASLNFHQTFDTAILRSYSFVTYVSQEVFADTPSLASWLSRHQPVIYMLSWTSGPPKSRLIVQTLHSQKLCQMILKAIFTTLPA